MLENKVALVTGAGRGIGRAIAIALAKEGAEVVVNYNGSEERAKEVKQTIEENGGKASIYKCNVSDFEACEAMIKDIVKEHGRLDILINNAGITKDGLIMKMKEEDFDSVLNVNLKGTFNTIRHSARQMLRQKSGKIINISSVSGILGNIPASGTEIIKQLGEEHIRTGKPIIYTSGDSVFQIAAHEDVIPVERLYELCHTARRILTGKHAVARVIARPFVGENGVYTRTPNRRDFSLKPSTDNILCRVQDKGLSVIGVGKIEDIFAGVGIGEATHTKDNQDGIDVTLRYMKQENEGIIYTNLVEFDSAWGHRNDVKGYARGLEEFDARLPEIFAAMRKDDMLIITADHGCDPTTPSTDHSREYVPLLMYGEALNKNVDLGTGKTYANIAQTIADIFGTEPTTIGESYAKKILKNESDNRKNG